MNLETHSCYPEIFIDSSDYSWSAKLISRSGHVMAKFVGQSASYDHARSDAAETITAAESDYILEEN